MNVQSININQAVDYLKQGKVIAYPTEAVYGLGCDPQNNNALQKILTIKQRSTNKGLILIAANISQIDFYVDLKSLPIATQNNIKQTWPGFTTWLLPINQQNLSQINPLIYGNFNTIAVRVTSHKTVQEICGLFNGPIISTSANTSGGDEIKNVSTMQKFILQHDAIAGLVTGDLGGYEKPSSIINAITGEKIR